MDPPNRRPINAYQPTVELEFDVTDERCFLVAEASTLDSELVLDDMLHQSGGNLIQFVSVYGNAALDVLSDAVERPDIVDAKVLGHFNTRGDAGLVELVTVGPSLARTVLKSRAFPRHISADRLGGRAVVEVPPSTDPQQVIEVFQDYHPDSKLIARREHETEAVVSESAFRERILSDLTDRQRETLVTAFKKGYFDTPRQTTAEECAAALDISQSTFSQHLNVAIYKVFCALFAEQIGE